MTTIVPARPDETGVHRRVLAEVALQAHAANVVVRVVEALDQVERSVRRPVVDEDQLVVAARERGRRPPVELLQRAGLVEDGDDDRNLRLRSRLIDRNGPGHLADGHYRPTPPRDRPRGVCPSKAHSSGGLFEGRPQRLDLRRPAAPRDEERSEPPTRPRPRRPRSPASARRRTTRRCRSRRSGRRSRRAPRRRRRRPARGSRCSRRTPGPLPPAAPRRARRSRPARRTAPCRPRDDERRDQLARTAWSACVTAAIQPSPMAWSASPVAMIRRPPIRSDSAPAIGATKIGIAVHGRIRRPEPNGE